MGNPFDGEVIIGLPWDPSFDGEDTVPPPPPPPPRDSVISEASTIPAMPPGISMLSPLFPDECPNRRGGDEMFTPRSPLVPDPIDSVATEPEATEPESHPKPYNPFSCKSDSTPYNPFSCDDLG